MFIPGGDVTVTLAIVHSEGFLKFLLDGFGVFVLYQEVRGNVGELVEVYPSGFLWIFLVDQVLQLTLVELLAQGVQNGGDLDRIDETALGRVEHLECFAHDDKPLFFIFLQNERNRQRYGQINEK